MARIVYVYDGPGASERSLELMLSSLRRCLCPKTHSIQRITPQEIKKEAWIEKCAALVFGGGYDLGFLSSLEQKGTDIIRNYVLQGGTYIGSCAGAYFACDHIEFEKGTRLEVCGGRPLKFYPGRCIGAIVPGFKYKSERGAAALPVSISVNQHLHNAKERIIHVYVNGGGFFSPYPSLENFPHVRKVENLAYFDSVDGRPPAMVKCEIGDRGGLAMLTSPHFEFAASELDQTDEYLAKYLKQLYKDDSVREQFLMSFLQMGNLTVKAKSSL